MPFPLPPPLPLLVSSTTFVNSRVYNFNCGCAHFRFRFIVVFATTSNAVVVVVAVFLAPNVACCYCCYCCSLSPRIKKRGLRIVRRSFSSTLAAAAAAVRLQFYFTFLRLSKKKKNTNWWKRNICVYIWPQLTVSLEGNRTSPAPPPSPFSPTYLTSVLWHNRTLPLRAAAASVES